MLIGSDLERNGTRADVDRRKRPRVLHMITSFDIGGTERQAIELLHRLDHRRFDVRLAILHRRGPLLEQIIGRFPEVPEFPLTSFYNLNAARQLYRLLDLLKRERIEILHAHDFYSGILGVAAARLSKIRVISAQRHLRLSERRVHEWGSRFITKFAHRVLVNSEAIRDYILSQSQRDPGKIVVIKNGLKGAADCRALRAEQRATLIKDLKLPADMSDERVRIVGSVARLQPVKGHKYLLEAVQRIMKTEPRVRLVLVGDGELRGELLQQASQLGIGDRVHLLGDRQDASQIAAAFDVAVLASLHEGLPNAVMEAMAAGVPVVASAVGGIKELIRDGETGLLVPPSDAGALADRLNYVLTHREQCIEMGMRGRHYILDRFSMERMVQSVENLYTEILGTRV
ncbi:MAG TPA: glycosyltransferase [Blastocatellia bacterium]|nr:glycosyltransferase [Blastocatellia bacterium]